LALEDLNLVDKALAEATAVRIYGHLMQGLPAPGRALRRKFGGRGWH
jgi:hypothetical protein